MGMQVSSYRERPILQSGGLGGIPSSVQENSDPVIFSKGISVNDELNMSKDHSNIARLVTRNENGATGIANIVNKDEKFAKDITLHTALEKLENAQDYNEDMKGVVLESIKHASTDKDKIAILEKGLAFLETEKKLTECVRNGKMELQEARELLTKTLNDGYGENFSLEELNKTNEKLTQLNENKSFEKADSSVNENIAKPTEGLIGANIEETFPAAGGSTAMPVLEESNGKIFDTQEHGEKFKEVVATSTQQSEPESASLPAGNPKPEIVNQSAMELMNGGSIENSEKEKTSLEQEDSTKEVESPFSSEIGKGEEYNELSRQLDEIFKKFSQEIKNTSDAEKINKCFEEMVNKLNKEFEFKLHEDDVEKIWNCVEKGEKPSTGNENIRNYYKYAKQIDDTCVILYNGIKHDSTSTEESVPVQQQQELIQEQPSSKSTKEKDTNGSQDVDDRTTSPVTNNATSTLSASNNFEEGITGGTSAKSAMKNIFAVVDGIQGQKIDKTKVSALLDKISNCVPKGGIDKTILKEIGKNENCTSEVVVGLLLSENLSFEEKMTILVNYTNEENEARYDNILSFCGDNQNLEDVKKVINLVKGIAEGVKGRTNQGYTYQYIIDGIVEQVLEKGETDKEIGFASIVKILLNPSNFSRDEYLKGSIDRCLEENKNAYISNDRQQPELFVKSIYRLSMFKDWIEGNEAQLKDGGKEYIAWKNENRDILISSSEVLTSIETTIKGEFDGLLAGKRTAKEKNQTDFNQLIKNIFSKDKETYVAAFNQLEAWAQGNSEIKSDPLYGLAMLRHDQKKITKESKYKEWKKENPQVNAQLLNRVCLEGMEFQDGKGIPLTLHKMQLLKDANKDGGQDFKTRPMYGLYLFKKGETEKFQKWATTIDTDGDDVDSEPFKELKNRLCLEGTSNQDGNGISLSADDIVALSTFDSNIEKTPAYGLALLNKGETEKFKTWATEIKEVEITQNGNKIKQKEEYDSEPFTELKNRLCLEGTSNQDGNGISLSANDIVELGNFDKKIQGTPVHLLALFKADKKAEYNKWAIYKDDAGNESDSAQFLDLMDKIYLEGTSHYTGKGIGLSVDDIVKLGDLDTRIQKTTIYKLATVFKNNAAQLTPGKEVKELRERAYVAGTDPILAGKNIPVPSDVYMQINFLTFDDAKELVSDINAGKGKKLGEGSFGNVYKVKGNDGKTYAVKIAKSTDDGTKAAFEQEKAANEYLYSNLSEEERKYFVDYYGGFEINGQYVFISEFIDSPEAGRRASFDDYIKDVHNGGNCAKEDFDKMTTLLQQGLERLAIEQRIGLLNRDIKPDNMMVSKDANGNLQLKGTDYGTACTYTGLGNPNEKGVGTPTFMSPEIIKQEPYSFSSDVYSIGISLLDGLFGGVFPAAVFNFPWKIADYARDGKVSEALKAGTFDGLAKGNVIAQENLDNLKRNLGDDADKKIGFLARLVADCTALNPQDRITAEQAAYLLGKFNGGNYDYAAVRSEAIQNHPKAIPDPIKAMLNSADLEEQAKGIEAVKRLILADPSYIETQSFKDLKSDMMNEIKASDEYNSARERLDKNKLSANTSTVQDTEQAQKSLETQEIKATEEPAPSTQEVIESASNSNISEEELDMSEPLQALFTEPPQDTENVSEEQIGDADTSKPVQSKSVEAEDVEAVDVSPEPEQSTGLNIDLDNEFAGPAIIQGLETILSDNYGALKQAKDFMLSDNYDVRKLNEFLVFVQENQHTPEEINTKADELFKA